MIFRRPVALLGALLLFAPDVACHGGISTLSSSGVPALAGAGGVTVTGGPTTYTVDFGQVAVGDQQQATLTLTNTGTSPLLITSAGAPSDPQFTTDLTPGMSIEAGGTSPLPASSSHSARE